MPGNRDIFEQALKRGNQFLWDKVWNKAIVEYEIALREFPSDPMALASAGFVYAQLKRMDEALKAYQNANRAQPNDPAIMARLAEVEERLGLTTEAARIFMALGDVHASRKTADKALACWERAARLDPDHVEVYQRLAAAYEKLGQDEMAARAHTALARLYRQAGQVDLAVAEAQAALALAPRHTGALRTLDEIKTSAGAAASAPAALPPAAGGLPPAASGPPAAPLAWDLDALAVEEEAAAGEGKGGSPVEAARDKAMSDLAETLFEDADELQLRMGSGQTGIRLSKQEVDALIGQALDYQRRGQIKEAIAAYRRILEAVDIAAAHFNLGLLYEQELRFNEAIEQFNQVVDHPEYTLGSRFALGECYRALGRVDQALENFIGVLKFVDLQMVRREQADDLIALYEGLADSYTTKGDREQAVAFTNSLVEFLSSRGWADKVSEARKRLDSIAEEGSPAISLVELFTVPNAEAVLHSIGMSQEYAKRDMYYLATDELYRAIERAPDYLPLHLRLAELLWTTDRTEEAVLKLRTIASTFQARGDMRHAINIYLRVLRMTPMDIPTRTMLIKLLISHGNIDGALDQYMQLADTYYQLAQIDRARETYQEALAYAPRGATGKLWTPKLYSCLGDIDMQRIDWRRAIQDYEQVKAYMPDDEKARLSLVELYYKLDQKQRAVRELDELMQLYQTAGKANKTIAILEDQVHVRSGEMPLRFRLARLYIESGMKDKAIEQLDVLGELQLQAGLKKEAAMTIRGIIGLAPPNVEEYKQLLAQMGV